MKKILFINTILIFFLAALSFAQSPKESMHNSLGHAYKAAGEENLDEAKARFKEAGKFAQEAKEWSGLVDAGNGFSALGEPEEALKYFNKAFKVSEKSLDWRGCVACGYAYASLPEKLKKDLPYKAFMKGRDIAFKKRDWRGLLETAKGINEIYAQTPNSKYKKAMTGVASSAYEIALEEKNVYGLRKAGNFFKAIGDYDRFKESLNAASRMEGIIKGAGDVPAGWKAYGETIATPKKIDAEIQALNSQFAEMDIQAKEEWTARQEATDKEMQTYAGCYYPYYAYPDRYYYYGYWYPLTSYQISTWALNVLGNYRYINGVYVYVGR